MHSIITSYLLQKGGCSIPSIGSFRTNFHSATVDIVEQTILPPKQEVVFNEGDFPPEYGLPQYIAYKLKMDVDKAKELLIRFGEEWKAKILAGEKLEFPGFGSLQTNPAGNIYFHSDAPHNESLKPVKATRVIRVNAQHAMLVGDKETTSHVMNAYFADEDTKKRSYWWVWAIVLFAIAATLITYTFSAYKHPQEAISNHNQLVPAPAPATHDVNKP